jgi:peroxiredoxin
MVANFCLITCVLFVAQQPEHAAWQSSPRLSRGQELVYRGSFAQEALGKGVQFSRSYRLENRVLVLDTSSRGLEVAFYTVLKLRVPQGDRAKEPPPNSVRLEVARVSSQGRLSADPGVVLTVPLDGPTTEECGMFVEMPRGRLTLNQTWEVTEDNRPARVWKVRDTEIVNNTNCLRIEGLQQSEDWDQPRGDRTAWRRRDTIWQSPTLGVAYKVERVVEQREPAHKDPTQRSVVQYELQTPMVYPGQLFENCRREILQAKKFSEEIAPYLPNPTRYGSRPFESMLVKIDHYLDNNPRSAYRDAILQVKRRVESARKGETPPLLADAGQSNGLTIGQRAPDFVTTDLLTGKSANLRLWQGRPLVMVFYTPKSLKAEEVLRFAQKLQDSNAGQVSVVTLAISDDTELLQKQQKDFSLSLPILGGKGLRQSYGVDATPKLVVIDGTVIVRGGFVGWGPETPASVTDEVNLWLRKDERPKQK